MKTMWVEFNEFDQMKLSYIDLIFSNYFYLLKEFFTHAIFTTKESIDENFLVEQTTSEIES
jgi:hypothetical protein